MQHQELHVCNMPGASKACKPQGVPVPACLVPHMFATFAVLARGATAE